MKLKDCRKLGITSFDLTSSGIQTFFGTTYHRKGGLSYVDTLSRKAEEEMWKMKKPPPKISSKGSMAIVQPTITYASVACSKDEWHYLLVSHASLVNRIECVRLEAQETKPC